MFIWSYFKLDLFKRRWRKLNRHNDSYAVDFFNPQLVEVGKNTYGGIRALTYNSDSKVIIGNYCSIGPAVVFIPSADHGLNYISTFPYKVKVLGKSLEGISKGNIIVDDDVWIGYGAVILSGIHIGQGAVIAAGAVVASDVPPYAIAGGVPAKVIKYRFNDELIKELLQIDYGQLTEEMIAEHAEGLYKELKDAEQIKWMPGKR